MNAMYARLQKCLSDVRQKTDFSPRIGIVLGSGLGHFSDEINFEAEIAYSEIDGFPVSTVEGHKGQFIFGHICDIPIVAMQGRVHFYEGYSMEDVVLPIRLMKMLGAEILILTNAVGAINTSFSVGDFMIITDHILSFSLSPLIGKNIDELGPRFPDMSRVYDLQLRKSIKTASTHTGIDVREGVYLQATGPNFETPAEIKAYSVMGVDVVGMSTACEAVAAMHMGMRVCGISCVSNMAAGISKTPLSHEEVQEAANIAAPQFKTLLCESIKRMV